MRLGTAHAGVLAALWLTAGAGAQPSAPPEPAAPPAAAPARVEPGVREPDEPATNPATEPPNAPATNPTGEPPNARAPNPLPQVTGPLRPDTDADGFFDAIDACPERSETRNGFEDDDGCPDVEPPPSRLPFRKPLPDWDEDERRWIAEDEREQCRNYGAVAGGIVLLVVGVSTLALGVGMGVMAQMYGGEDRGDEPSDGYLAMSVLSLALGAAGVGGGIAALISGSTWRPCSERAACPSPAPQVVLGPAGGALRWSF